MELLCMLVELVEFFIYEDRKYVCQSTNNQTIYHEMCAMPFQ